MRSKFPASAGVRPDEVMDDPTESDSVGLHKNLSYSSLQVKKMKGQYAPYDLWEARVDRKYRFSFHQKGKDVHLYRVGTHDEVI